MPVLRSVDLHFFKKWTAPMAYALGFFAADGNMIKTKRGTHFISFNSSDKSLLQSIQKEMQSTHKLSMRKSPTGSVFRFQIGSKEMYQDLIRLGFIENKSKRMIVPDIPKKFQRHFVRGYFDGDGNVWVGKMNLKRATPQDVLFVAFTSGSTGFLQGLWNLLRNNGIPGGSLYNSKTKHFSRLQLSTGSALKLGEFMYNRQPKLYLKRKRLRFDKFKAK